MRNAAAQQAHHGSRSEAGQRVADGRAPACEQKERDRYRAQRKWAKWIVRADEDAEHSEDAAVRDDEPDEPQAGKQCDRAACPSKERAPAFARAHDRVAHTARSSSMYSSSGSRNPRKPG